MTNNSDNNNDKNQKEDPINNSNNNLDEYLDGDLENNNILGPSDSPSYVSKEDKYLELKSSGYSFLVVSIIGIILLVLNIIKVISIFYGIFSYIILGAVFVLFLIIGITTLKNASQISLEIDAENAQTRAINNWLYENIGKCNLNKILDRESFEHDEAYYLKLMEKIKELVKKNFKGLDDNYIESIIEEYYDKHLD